MAVQGYKFVSPSAEPRGGAERSCPLGTLPSHGLARLLLGIAERRLTGRLVLTGEHARRVVFFGAGNPLFAKSTRERERLGSLAVGAGLLDDEALWDALACARGRDSKLGVILLERSVLSGAELFALLGVQLLMQLGSACLEGACQATFLPDPDTAWRVPALPVHPLTPVLVAVDALAPSERAALMAFCGPMRLGNTEFSRPVSAWLRALGYGGYPSALLNRRMPVSILAARLRERVSPAARNAYDPRGLPGASALSLSAQPASERETWPDAEDLADRVILTMLLAGVLVPADPADLMLPAISPDASEHGVDHAAAIGALLASEQSLVSGLPDEEPPPASGAGATPAWFSYAYLRAPRSPELAARLAVWGACGDAENADDDLDELLALYLRVTAETRAWRVLELAGDSPEHVVRARHAQLCSVLGAEGADEAQPEPLSHAKREELRLRFDRALSALLGPSAVPAGSDAARGSHVGLRGPPGNGRVPGAAAGENAAPYEQPAGHRREGAPVGHSDVVPVGTAAARRDAELPIPPIPRLPQESATDAGPASITDRNTVSGRSSEWSPDLRAYASVYEVGWSGRSPKPESMDAGPSDSHTGGWWSALAPIVARAWGRMQGARPAAWPRSVPAWAAWAAGLLLLGVLLWGSPDTPDPSSDAPVAPGGTAASRKPAGKPSMAARNGRSGTGEAPARAAPVRMAAGPAPQSNEDASGHPGKHVRAASAGTARAAKNERARAARSRSPRAGRRTARSAGRATRLARTRRRVAATAPSGAAGRRGARVRTRLRALRVDDPSAAQLVSQALQRTRGAFARCFARAAARAGRPRYGKARVRALIDPRGRVLRPWVRGGPLPGLNACITQVASGMKVPVRKRGTRLKATWVVEYSKRTPRKKRRKNRGRVAP